MTHQEAATLVEKYFAADTTPAEEAALRGYFAGAEVHPSLAAYRPLFVWAAAERNLQPAADFEARLMARIAAQEAEATHGRVRPIWTGVRHYLARVAAVLLPAAVALWLLWPAAPAPESPIAEAPSAIDWSKYEPETVEEAYEVTRKALMRVSTVINDGAQQAAQGMGKVGEIGRVLE